MKILANDGISKNAIDVLEKAGMEVFTTTVAQGQLINFIQNNKIDALLVRSATKVRKDIIDACPSLKLIGRGGVGMDNIDVEHAKSKGIYVINTPAASSESVAELVFAHLFGGARFLYDANRNMPLEGDTNFKELKKSYSKGTELRGKTLGIFGFGNIGQATACLAIGAGMKVIYHDPEVETANIELGFYDHQKVSFQLKNTNKAEVLKNSDYISLHVPEQQEYILSKSEFAKMKKGVGIINAARGGVLDEVALVEALENGTVAFAGLDVFESEPKPEMRLLMHSSISLSPHIGAATLEAQERIGLELAEQIISLLN